MALIYLLLGIAVFALLLWMTAAVDRACPGIDRAHARDQVRAGDEPVPDEGFRNPQPCVHVRKGRVDEEWALHANWLA